MHIFADITFNFISNKASIHTKSCLMARNIKTCLKSPQETDKRQLRRDSNLPSFHLLTNKLQYNSVEISPAVC